MQYDVFQMDDEVFYTSDSLTGEVYERYLAKTSVIGIDPYQIPESDFSYDYSDLPDVFESNHIAHYCLNTKSPYTWEDLLSYKSLESYNQFVNGWVGEIRCRRFTEYVVVRASVRHSQSANKAPLQPWVITEITGKVLSGHCDCMAGLGEVCTHVSAMLFAMEAIIKIRNNKTVTDEPAYWMLPNTVKKIPYAPIAEIDFRLHFK